RRKDQRHSENPDGSLQAAGRGLGDSLSKVLRGSRASAMADHPNAVPRARLRNSEIDAVALAAVKALTQDCVQNFHDCPKSSPKVVPQVGVPVRLTSAQCPTDGNIRNHRRGTNSRLRRAALRSKQLE